MIYRMPAEWEPHEATWLAWPHLEKHWPGKLKTIPPVYAEIIRALISVEKVFVCVNDAKMEKSARDTLAKAGVKFNEKQLKFFHVLTDASWSRDHGPIFVRDKKGKLIITDWKFNAWGKQWPYKKDDVVPQKIGKLLNIPVVKPGIVLEGGSIDVNGQGTLLTTRQCLLNKNRNPKLNQKQIEKYLRNYLGVTNILWLDEGIIGDDTSGHIDDLARFIDQNTVVCPLETNKRDENYPILKKNFDDLKKMRVENGKPLRVITVPMPEPIIYRGQRLPASYVNFYIANSVVLVPTFNNTRDREALKILRGVFSKRKVISINCQDLIWGLGAIHCSTQQQPKA